MQDNEKCELSNVEYNHHMSRRTYKERRVTSVGWRVTKMPSRMPRLPRVARMSWGTSMTMRALFEKIPELHMIVETDASALVQMNELRNKFEVCAITLESPNFPVV
jgi:hypothetical protein